MAKSRNVKVDLSDVDTDGPGVVPDDDYLIAVKKVEEKEGESSGEPYLNWQLKIKKGDHKGKILYHITTLQPQGLFNLRKTLEAGGIEIPSRAMDLDLDELENLEFMVTTEQEEYKGKNRSRVIDTYPVGGEKSSEDDDEAPTPKKKSKDEDDESPAPKKKGKKAKFEEGQKVKFEVDGDDMVGKIVSVSEEDSKATIKVKGEEWDVDFSDLEAA